MYAAKGKWKPKKGHFGGRAKQKGEVIYVDFENHIVIDAFNALVSMGDTAVYQKRKELKSGIDYRGNHMPTPSDEYLRRKLLDGYPTNDFLVRTGKFVKSYKRYKPVIRRSNIDYSYIQVGQPASQYWKGRGLTGQGYFWHNISSKSKRMVLARLRASKIFKTKRGTPKK